MESQTAVVYENNGATAEAKDAVDTAMETAIQMESPTKKIHGTVMSFHDISYTVNIEKPCCGSCRRSEPKTILHGVSGILRPGLNALMGPTGSGKSSLLDVLAKRKDPSCVTGSVYLDGKPIPKNFQYLSGYVVQNDLFVPTVTVREALWFCANLRLRSSIPNDEKRRKIQQVIEDLSLEACADTKVGNELIRGISGGEKKRTSIATELMLEPQILFLDEPTTGLDSATAWSVVSLLKRLGDQGRTIVCSIHQPRYSIYKMFDTLTLLAKGHMVYQGPTSNALEYFENLGFVCETHDNPADFYLDVLNGGHERVGEQASSDKSHSKLVDLTNSLKESFDNSVEKEELRVALKEIESEMVQAKVESGKMYASGLGQQLKVLLARTGKNMIRNPQLLIGNAVINALIGIVFGLIYFQIPDTVEKGRQNRFGILFFICTNLLFSSQLVIDSFIKEREIFFHEHVSGYYSVFSYFLSKVMADLIPLRTIPPIIFGSITYWMVGMKAEAGAFFIFLLTAILVGYASVGIGLFYSATFSQNVGQMVIILTFISTIIFSGLLVNVDSIVDWLSWLKYLSIARYGLVAFSINEFRGLELLQCGNSTPSFAQSASTMCPPAFNATGTPIANGTACVTVKAERFIFETLAVGNKDYVYSDWDLWQNLLALACIILGLFTLTYIQLVRRKKYS